MPARHETLPNHAYVGGGAAGKSAEDAALVTGLWSQESAANSAASPMRLRSGLRLGVAAPVADEQ